MQPTQKQVNTRYGIPKITNYLPLAFPEGDKYHYSEYSQLRFTGILSAEGEYYKVMKIGINLKIEVNRDKFYYDAEKDFFENEAPRSRLELREAADGEKYQHIVFDPKKFHLAPSLGARLIQVFKPQKAIEDNTRAWRELVDERQRSFATEDEELDILDKREQDLTESVIKVRGSKMTLTSPNERTSYIQIDLSPLVPEGWIIIVKRLAGADRWGQFGIIVCHPDHFDEVSDVRLLTNEDLHQVGTTLCSKSPSSTCENFTDSVSIKQRTETPMGTYILPNGDPMGFRVKDTTELSCARDSGHKGDHQAVLRGSYFRWDEESLENLFYLNGQDTQTPMLEFGFKNICPQCSFIHARNAVGNDLCMKCDSR